MPSTITHVDIPTHWLYCIPPRQTTGCNLTSTHVISSNTASTIAAVHIAHGLCCVSTRLTNVLEPTTNFHGLKFIEDCKKFK
uniref:Uncharacterized protein n=1 Tax=Lepeophtheirus salmonis TaxID=72036 RepID=A0A0K2TJN4_LEPSM